jgi:hypothetical protein
MPRSRRKKTSWGKRATQTSIVLVFIASVPMNLLTSWLHDDVLINIFYLFLVLFLLVAIIYIYQSKKKRPHDLLNKVFWFLVATVALNLFSIWIQEKVLQNKYSVSSITLFLLVAIITLAASALFESHFYRRKVQSINMKRIWLARNNRPPGFPKFQVRNGMKRPLPKPRSRRKKNT